MKRGLLYGAAAYFMWGVFPIYWKLLNNVDATEILMHRMVWSLVFLVIVLAIRKHWHWLRIVRNRPKILLTITLSALLLGLNWFTFIWAINHGFIVEASLGYFINPLLNVALGVIFLRERLRRWQGVAIAIALLGVIYLTVTYGAVPWIALTLALTFGLYALLRKTAALDTLEGLSLEMALLFLPALAFILYGEFSGTSAFLHSQWPSSGLLILAGAVTAIPLLFFSAAVRRAPLVVIGLLQYLAPTLQFAIGVLIYGEPFNSTRFIGFCVIWVALIIYAGDGVIRWRRRPAAARTSRGNAKQPPNGTIIFSRREIGRDNTCPNQLPFKLIPFYAEDLIL